MLCPYYELALANRFPRKIEADVLNLVFQLKEADFAARISQGRFKYKRNKRTPSGQTSFEMTTRSDETESDAIHEYDCDAE